MEKNYSDIVHLNGGIEVIPVWKQCGKRNPNWSKDEKSLWDSGDYTQHMLYVNPAELYVNADWWVWKGYELGNVSKEIDGTYTAHIHIVMTRSEVHGFKTIDSAAYRLAVGKHDINPNNPGMLFKTTDGRYYDLNGDEVKL
jgi:hypothetical protein